MKSYARTPAELRRHAALFWPRELAAKQQTTNVIPQLIRTQDQFISILTVADSSPVAWKGALNLSKQLPPNLFLKHLMVLSDVGGEALDRIKRSFSTMFPRSVMRYGWGGRTYSYTFRGIPDKKVLGNSALGVDGKGLSRPLVLSPIVEDVCMLLLHGSAILDRERKIPDFVQEKCVIGALIGKPSELQQFVKERYIWVSRITGGATANAMGQLAQDFVKERLEHALPGWKITRNGSIPKMSQNAGVTDINFDIVAQSPRNRYCAIEVSFQFTTNSTIERKAGQAKTRFDLLHRAGHRIAYVIDGAGNFKRAAALTTICRYSDCTVALVPSELQYLAKFLQVRVGK